MEEGSGTRQAAPEAPDSRPPPPAPAPLKGIPKQAPFRSPTAPSVFSPAGNRTPIPPSRTPLRKERGVKVGTGPAQLRAGLVRLRQG